MEDRKTGKQPQEKPIAYEPPRAVFVPLKLEERILSCGKYPPPGTPECAAGSRAMS